MTGIPATYCGIEDLFPFTFRTDDAHMKEYDGLPVRITELLSRAPDRSPNDGLFRVEAPSGLVFNAEFYELHPAGRLSVARESSRAHGSSPSSGQSEDVG